MQMENLASISIYLDSRRAKANGSYPVKLRVFTTQPRKQMLYSIPFEYSKEDFKKVWSNKRINKDLKNDNIRIDAIRQKAVGIAKDIQPFSFERFEKLLFRKTGEGGSVKYHYNDYISSLKKNARIGTAETYFYSLKAIIKYLNTINQNIDKLMFYDINIKWLKLFENHLLTSNLSITTVGIYLRPLRAMFNKAIEEGEIDKELYPFGKRGYQIPNTKKVKKALSLEQLKILYQAKPENKEQEKAKDFWFLSYNCNGMNLKDLALLKLSNLNNDSLIFYRAKTYFTSKHNLKEIQVYFNDFIIKILDKYGNKDKTSTNYVFDIIKPDYSEVEIKRRVSNFNRFINQHIKKLAQNNGINEDISFYWARHSFATNSVRQGASLEFMQESLGHNSKTTTENYFAGFGSDVKREFAKTLMNFDKKF